MTRFLPLILVAAIGSAASAGESDRYNDIRLDTGVDVSISFADAAPTHTVQTAEAAPLPRAPRFSTRNAQPRIPYAYSQRFGVGPYNDSR